MAEDLFKFPWVSKTRGTTVHLLKASAKKARKPPKRRKYELLKPNQRSNVDLFASYKKNVEQMDQGRPDPSPIASNPDKDRSQSQIDTYVK